MQQQPASSYCLNSEIAAAASKFMQACSSSQHVLKLISDNNKTLQLIT